MFQVFEKLGIEHQFWKIMGEWNPLSEYEFHELTFHQRVSLIKALCDFVMVSLRIYVLTFPEFVSQITHRTLFKEWQFL
jgi:hypothetical protein